MADLNPQYIGNTGLAPVYGAANAGGDAAIITDGTEILHVKNGGGASINVTLTRQQTTKQIPGEGNIALSNIVVSVPAGSDRFISNIGASLCDSTSRLQIGYSAVTSVTVALLKANRP